MRNQINTFGCIVIIVIAIFVGVMSGEAMGTTNSPEKPDTVAAKQLRKYIGTWRHETDGDKSLVLMGYTDDEGDLRFKFLEQHFSYQPVYYKCSVDNDCVEIYFKLVTYYSDEDSKHTIKYVLKRNKKNLKGQFVQSWKEPLEVSLKPLGRAGTVEILSSLANEINRLKFKNGESSVNHKRQIGEYIIKVKSLEKKLAQSQEHTKQLQQQLEQVRQAMTEVKEKTGALIDEVLRSLKQIRIR